MLSTLIVPSFLCAIIMAKTSTFRSNRRIGPLFAFFLLLFRSELRPLAQHKANLFHMLRDFKIQFIASFALRRYKPIYAKPNCDLMPTIHTNKNKSMQFLDYVKLDRILW